MEIRKIIIFYKFKIKDPRVITTNAQ